MAQSRGPSVFCYNGLQIVDDGGDFDANNMWSVKKHLILLIKHHLSCMN